MKWLKALIGVVDEWFNSRHERAKLMRVEEELRIQRQLEWLESRRTASETDKIVTISQSELMGQSIVDLSRRC
jgi:hypothetical protein